MKLILQAVTKYGFNERTLTEQDFYDICTQEAIEVREMAVPASFYFRCLNVRCIVLKRGLSGLRRRYVMFHELAHALVTANKPGPQAFGFGHGDARAEFEADALATIALVPRSALASYEFLEENPTRFARKLFRERQRLEFLYGV